jgi:undecaprenyl diphosphate synthase
VSTSTLPRHIAIVMDGNGRWAKQRHLPRIAGHKAGVKAVREAVKFCVQHHIEVLTLFAFSSENWRRPATEVNHLMELFIIALEREAAKLNKQNIQLRIIGDRTRFDEKLQNHMTNAEELTANNTGLKLLIAANYGGQWDVTAACRRLALDVQQGKLAPNDITAELIEANLVTADLPLPDLFIRTGGEQRISNFLIWQLSYAELYFTDVHWPDFDAAELTKAMAFFTNRELRFGHTSEQLRAENHA